MRETVSDCDVGTAPGEQSSYLIAQDLFDGSRSGLLGRATLSKEQQLQPPYDLSGFVGKGYQIHLGEKIAAAEDADDIVVTLDVGGAPQVFEVSHIVATFPLVEGTFVPGIYAVWEQQYWALDSVAALSEAIETDPDLWVSEYKIVCRADAVDVMRVPGGESIYSVQRHPYSFFDVFCPVCQHRVMTGEKSQSALALNRYEVVEAPCPHFVGNAVYTEGAGYEPDALEECGRNYKFVNGELHFESPPGEWQKAIIHSPPGDSVSSYWSSCDSEYRSDFFFLKN